MNPTGDGGDREQARSSFGYARYSTIGLQFAFMLTLPIFAGHWVDEHWGIGPWCTLAGALFGFAGGTAWLYRRIYSDEDAKKNRAESDGG